MVVYAKDTGKHYKVTGLKDKKQAFATIKNAAVDTYEVLVPEVDLTGYATNAYVDEKIWVGTQEEFDAIVTKNPNTVYLVKE